MNLAWDPNPDPAAAGYNIYYGCASRSYTNSVDAGAATSITISNLVPGVTYWFAATTYDLVGLESDYSAEASYIVPSTPFNRPPTLDPPDDLSINEDAGPQTVNLTGISSGATNEAQTLSVAATSSNPSLIPNPTVNYTSPNTTGTLTFQPVAGSFGSVSMTVLVDDGGAVSNTVIRSFNVVVNPVNDPPTLDQPSDIVMDQNAGLRTVNLTGITSGAANENQTLTVTATSSNPSLIPNPTASYASPNTNATLSFQPVTNAFGSAVISVVVSDGQPTNSTVSRNFSVTVNQVSLPLNTITNVVVVPNEMFRCALYPPFTNDHRITYDLDASAPAGARILTKKGVPTFTWRPAPAQASTTNLINIQITDTRDHTLNTNAFIRIVVLDYLAVIPGSTSVQAGQDGFLPLAVSCSDGLTNVSFLLSWPDTRFSNPSLTQVSSSIASNSVQVQGTNLLIRMDTQPGQMLLGSNFVANLRFQTTPAQSSAFVTMRAELVAGAKPTGLTYVNAVGESGQVTVIGDFPLLQTTGGGASSLGLLLYGRVGTAYELQYCTNLAVPSPAVWYPLLTYTQTNVSQPLTVTPGVPAIFYRLKQQ